MQISTSFYNFTGCVSILLMLTFILSGFLPVTLVHAGDSKFSWAKGMGGTSFDSGNSIIVDSSGNVYTTGYFNGTVDFDHGPGTFNLTSAGSEDIYISKLGKAFDRPSFLPAIIKNNMQP